MISDENRLEMLVLKTDSIKMKIRENMHQKIRINYDQTSFHFFKIHDSENMMKMSSAEYA